MSGPQNVPILSPECGLKMGTFLGSKYQFVELLFRSFFCETESRPSFRELAVAELLAHYRPGRTYLTPWPLLWAPWLFRGNHTLAVWSE